MKCHRFIYSFDILLVIAPYIVEVTYRWPYLVCNNTDKHRKTRRIELPRVNAMKHFSVFLGVVTHQNTVFLQMNAGALINFVSPLEGAFF